MRRHQTTAQGKDTQSRKRHSESNEETRSDPRIEKPRLEELNQAIKNLERPTHPHIQKVMQTRGYILAEYGLIAKELYKMGHKNEARLISKLAKDMVGQPLSTKAQQEYDQKSDLKCNTKPALSSNQMLNKTTTPFVKR